MHVPVTVDRGPHGSVHQIARRYTSEMCTFHGTTNEKGHGCRDKLRMKFDGKAFRYVRHGMGSSLVILVLILSCVRRRINDFASSCKGFGLSHRSALPLRIGWEEQEEEFDGADEIACIQS